MAIVSVVSILDDARPGMNPDIRPQDDLFGHVNGRWLDETEIPSDRSSWGPFVQLADVAESQVRDIITSIADDAGRPTSMTRAARSATSSPPSWTRPRSTSWAPRPIQPLVAAVAGLRDVRDLAAFLGEFERIGGAGLFGSYVDTDDRNSDRYLFHIAQGGLGLPDESYYRDDKFAEVREKYVAYLTRLLELGEHADAGGRGRRPSSTSTPSWRPGHWERAETRDVQKTYNLTTLEELKALAPSFDWDAYVTNLGGNDADDRRVLRPAAVLPRAPLDRARRGAHRGLEVVAAQPCAAERCGVPPQRVRRDQLRLLRPHPQRHPRAARALEARGLARRGRPG